MKFEKAMVKFIDLGEEEILTTSGGCDNHGHSDVHPNCTNPGNRNVQGKHNE